MRFGFERWSMQPLTGTSLLHSLLVDRAIVVLSADELATTIPTESPLLPIVVERGWTPPTREDTEFVYFVYGGRAFELDTVVEPLVVNVRDIYPFLFEDI